MTVYWGESLLLKFWVSITIWVEFEGKTYLMSCIVLVSPRVFFVICFCLYYMIIISKILAILSCSEVYFPPAVNVEKKNPNDYQPAQHTLLRTFYADAPYHLLSNAPEIMVGIPNDPLYLYLDVKRTTWHDLVLPKLYMSLITVNPSHP